jgi:hypothetical protein
MTVKTILYSTLVAGAALGPAALVNGTILDNQCDGQLRAGCQGLPPAQHHVDQREPSLPLLGANQVYAVTTSTTPIHHNGYGSLVSGPGGLTGFGDVLRGTNTSRGPFNLT